MAAGVAPDSSPSGLTAIDYSTESMSGMLSPLTIITETVGDYSESCFRHNADSVAMFGIADGDNLSSSDCGSGSSGGGDRLGNARTMSGTSGRGSAHRRFSFEPDDDDHDEGEDEGSSEDAKMTSALPEFRQHLATESQEQKNRSATAGKWGQFRGFLYEKEYGVTLRKGQTRNGKIGGDYRGKTCQRASQTECKTTRTLIYRM